MKPVWNGFLKMVKGEEEELLQMNTWKPIMLSRQQASTERWARQQAEVENAMNETNDELILTMQDIIDELQRRGFRIRNIEDTRASLCRVQVSGNMICFVTDGRRIVKQ